MTPAIDWKWVESEVVRTEKVKGDLRDALSRSLKKAKEIARPKVIFAKKALRYADETSLELEDGFTLCGWHLSSYLKGADYLYLFLATIGPGLEEMATSLMNNDDEVGGYLLDRIGSFAVESLAASYEKVLREHYSRLGSSASGRMSPGYCDWPIEEQSKLDSLLEFSSAGVRLTETFMMIPRKSISAAIGIGPKEMFKTVSSQCDICGKKDCDFRR